MPDPIPPVLLEYRRSEGQPVGVGVENEAMALVFAAFVTACLPPLCFALACGAIWKGSRVLRGEPIERPPDRNRAILAIVFGGTLAVVSGMIMIAGSIAWLA